MRVLVCGGRDWDDWESVYRELDKRSPTMVINGGAMGADQNARMWARDKNVPCVTLEADWTRLGRRAGPIRNQAMLDELRPDLVLAFPGGRGTADMVRRARKAGVEVVEVR